MKNCQHFIDNKEIQKGMFGLKSSHGGYSKDPLVYCDIRVDSPYKDLVLIRGSPLESNPVPLNGRLLFSLSHDMLVKKISLKLIGRFKLDFLQMGRDNNRSGVTSIVKDQKTVLETRWENLLVSSQGNTVIGDDKHYAGDAGRRELAKRSLSSPVVNRLIKKNSSHVLELPTNGVTGTPYKDLYSSSSYVFHLPKGNYDLPFQVILPSEIMETVEGLQSGSLLYNFEARIDRKRKSSSVTSLLKEDLEALHLHQPSMTTYKYLRIFRTLAPDDLSLQQEMSVGATCKDKIQYEVSIPSKAIAIGDSIPIHIRLFPFQKGYILDKINASLLQFYLVRDNAGQPYDDQQVMTKQSLTEFDEFLNNPDRLLTDVTEINSIFQTPDNLKKITQDCDLRGDLIQVRHKLAIKIVLTRAEDTTKRLEIKANLPVSLYISPLVGMKGRLVLFDNANGNIHFRAGELVQLFTDGSSTPQRSTTPAPAPAPPNYQDRLKDHLLGREQQPMAIHSAPNSPPVSRDTRSPHTQDDYFTQVPSYEQSWQGVATHDEPPPPLLP